MSDRELYFRIGCIVGFFVGAGTVALGWWLS